MKTKEKNSEIKIPSCIGVILDGNRRWAKERGLPLPEGHREGYKKLKQFVSWATEAGINNIIVYAFSTDNWHRAKIEVSYLMELLKSALTDEVVEAKKNNSKFKVKIVGQINRFSKDIQLKALELEEKSKNIKGPTLAFALSYGGREEILDAAKKVASLGEKAKKLSEKQFSKMLWTADLPDPDLIIRTGGELRLSNFLPWQAVYSELFLSLIHI